MSRQQVKAVQRNKPTPSKKKESNKQAQAIEHRKDDKGPESPAAIRLLSQIVKGESKSLKQQVAHTLNYFPAARDSDITLTIRLLEIFYPEVIDSEGRMHLDEMYKLPKFYDMQRHRAHIQNDLGLFRASPEIEALREKRQYKKADEFAAAQPDYRSVFIFADESGIEQDYLILGSIWLASYNEHFTLTQALAQWRQENNITSELHFRTIGNAQSANNAIAFFLKALSTGTYISFRCLIIKNSKLTRTRRSDAPYEGLLHMMIRGVRTELRTRRWAPPLRIHFIKDANPSTDVIKYADFELKAKAALASEYPNRSVTLEGVANPVSDKNDLVQIADLFTSSVGRWINIGISDPTRSPKDKVASIIGNALNIRTGRNGLLRGSRDQCTIEYLDFD